MNLDQPTQPTVRERLEFALLGLPFAYWLLYSRGG
jgi:hypothetical protein